MHCVSKDSCGTVNLVIVDGNNNFCYKFLWACMG